MSIPAIWNLFDAEGKSTLRKSMIVLSFAIVAILTVTKEINMNQFQEHLPNSMFFTHTYLIPNALGIMCTMLIYQILNYALTLIIDIFDSIKKHRENVLERYEKRKDPSNKFGYGPRDLKKYKEDNSASISNVKLEEEIYRYTEDTVILYNVSAFFELTHAAIKTLTPLIFAFYSAYISFPYSLLFLNKLLQLSPTQILP